MAQVTGARASRQEAGSLCKPQVLLHIVLSSTGSLWKPLGAAKVEMLRRIYDALGTRLAF